VEEGTIGAVLHHPQPIPAEEKVGMMQRLEGRFFEEPGFELAQFGTGEKA
jgi:hypothetical protein